MSVILAFPWWALAQENTDEREKETGELMMVSLSQGKLFDSRSRAATRTEQHYPNSVSARRSNENLMDSVAKLSRRCSVKEGTWKMQSPFSLPMPECRDQGENLEQNRTEIRAMHN